MVKVKYVAKQLLTITLLLVSLLNCTLSMFTYSNSAKAGTIGKMGTNAILGSPVLNMNAVSDSWNKYETLVWGIFLSNFCQPFVDDYESALNTSSTNGSKGAGTRALSFGTGNDVANNKSLQDLTTYAINHQSLAAKQILVSYNKMVKGEYTTTCGFGNNPAAGTGTTTGSTTGSTTTGSTTTPPATGSTTTPPATATTTVTETIRSATLQDLFIKAAGTEENNKLNIGKADESWSDFYLDGDKRKATILKYCISTTYPNMTGVLHANIPTFAIKGVDDTYEIVLDYRESYDLEMFAGALSRALSGDYRSTVVDILNSDTVPLSSIPLYIDTFGNICISLDGRFIVIIPASANQYLTKTPSINMVNSLIFNCGGSANNPNTMVNMAGQGAMDKSFFQKIGGGAGDVVCGGLAFTNDNEATKNGGMAIFYDTDTLVMNDIMDVGLDSEPGGHLVYNSTVLKNLYDLDISEPSNTVQFKIEPVNIGEKTYKGLDDKAGEAAELVEQTLNTASSLVNLLKSTGGQPRLTSLKNFQGGNDIELFTDAVVIPVQAEPGVNSSGNRQMWSALRSLSSYMYQCYSGQLTTKSGTGLYEDSDRDFMQKFLSDTYPSTLDMMDALIINKDHFTDFAKGFIKMHNGTLYNIQDADRLDEIKKGSLGNVPGASDMICLNDVTPSKGGDIVEALFKNPAPGIDSNSNAKLAQRTLGRTVKLYYTSPVISEVSSILGLRDGTDFATYSANIYLTYLDWYGLNSKSLTAGQTANLNMNILNENSTISDINEVTDMKSEADMKADVLKYTYMMLSPEEGQSYRSNIIMSNMSSWIYDQYQRLVFGSASSFSYGNVSTKNNTGFLSIENYSENFMTSWFMDNYASYAIIIIAMGIAIVVLVGVLRKRKGSWFLLAIILVVNVVLVLPSTGEIVPYVANNVVQSLFSDKMTYWSISEQATNATIEKDYITEQSVSGQYTRNLTSDEKSQVLSLVGSLKALSLDRFISIKQDISNKVTSSDSADYDSVQSLKSTRWLLPMVMRQYTASDKSANYVYVTLGDKLEDISNLYWYYNAADAEFAKTVNAKSEDKVPAVYGGAISNDKEHNAWSPFKDIKSASGAAEPYQCISYTRNPSLSPHTYFYMIETTNGKYPLSGSITDKGSADYKNFDTLAADYAESCKNGGEHKNLFDEAVTDIQEYAPAYDRYNREKMYQIYGFLWNTESPLHYFYETVKDSFLPSTSIGGIAFDLQGEYTSKDETGVRKSFMYDGNTGNVRDIVDLENLFTNVMPYMYSVQLATGGYDGKSGLYGDEKIADYKVYKDSLVSWLFRSNWVTKMMENSTYNGPGSISYIDSNGDIQDAIVKNQMFPQFYEDAGRKMIFSEAQQKLAGLTDADLTLVELKCIEINKDIARKWTLMLNYISVKGISKEVILRQMAVDAMLVFNSNFNSSGVVNNSKMMYPIGLDLRSISFDSVMCMLMLNVTHDTSYVYKDTMEVLIKDSDVFTAMTLLMTAFLCALIIPLIRCVTLGLLFFLGFFSVLRTLFRDTSEKVATSLGYMGCHIVYLCVNIAYLLSFKLLMSMTTTDEVLTLTTTEISTQNPIWCLLIVIALSCFYINASWRMIIFCIKNYKDMGAAALKGAIELFSTSVSGGFEKMSGKLAELSETGESGDNKSKSGAIDKASKDKGKGAADNGTKQSKGSGSGGGSAKSGDNKGESSNGNNSNGPAKEDDLHYANGKPNYDDTDASDVNDTIKRGKEKMETSQVNGNQGNQNQGSQNNQNNGNQNQNNGNQNNGNQNNQKQGGNGTGQSGRPNQGNGNQSNKSNNSNNSKQNNGNQGKSNNSKSGNNGNNGNQNKKSNDTKQNQGNNRK